LVGSPSASTRASAAKGQLKDPPRRI
jgi:hypothetical protein